MTILRIVSLSALFIALNANIAQAADIQLEASKEIQKTDSVINLQNLQKRVLAKGKRSANVELFNKEISHDGLVVVKFFATWCPPCKRLSPIFYNVAKKLTEVTVNGKKIAVKYLEVDIDMFSDIKQNNNIKSYPTIVYFSKGKEVARTPRPEDENTLSEHVKKFAAQSLTK